MCKNVNDLLFCLSDTFYDRFPFKLVSFRDSYKIKNIECKNFQILGKKDELKGQNIQLMHNNFKMNKKRYHILGLLKYQKIDVSI